MKLFNDISLVVMAGLMKLKCADEELNLCKYLAALVARESSIQRLRGW